MTGVTIYGLIAIFDEARCEPTVNLQFPGQSRHTSTQFNLPRRAATYLIMARLTSTALFMRSKPHSKLLHRQFPLPRPAVANSVN